MKFICRIVIFYLLTINSTTSNHGNTVVIEVGSSDQNIKIVLGMIKTIPEVEVLHIEVSGSIVVHVYDEQIDILTQILRESHLIDTDNLIINRVEDIKMASEYRRKKRSLSINNSTSSEFQVDEYNTYDSILNYLEDLQLSHPDLCDVIEIGRSTEGRPIKVIRLTANNNESKPAVYIEGGQHAREWITPATILKIIDKMIGRYRVHESIITALLQKYEFYFNPIVNPDGYHYTYLQPRNRMWRKNRRINLNTTCEGVDLNRNWDFHWAGIGSSAEVCSNRYHGPQPFSEPETRATSKFLLEHRGTWLSYFSFHSFGQLILYPYSHTIVPAPDQVHFQSAGQALADGINMHRNTTYRVGSITSLLYRASGSSESWAYELVGIPYAYTLELPTRSSFFVSTYQINPISTELLDGLWKYLEHIEKDRPELIEEIKSNLTRHTQNTTEGLLTTTQRQQTSTSQHSTVELVKTKHCVGVFCQLFQTTLCPVSSNSYIVRLDYIIIFTTIVLWMYS